MALDRFFEKNDGTNDKNGSDSRLSATATTMHSYLRSTRPAARQPLASGVCGGLVRGVNGVHSLR
jgi:hypothetical protein